MWHNTKVKQQNKKDPHETALFSSRFFSHRREQAAPDYSSLRKKPTLPMLKLKKLTQGLTAVEMHITIKTFDVFCSWILSRHLFIPLVDEE